MIILMASPPEHRKRVKHYDSAGEGHELTFSCYKRLPLFSDHRWIALLSQSIDSAMQTQGYELNAFVIMPEHVHLLIFPGRAAQGVDRLLSAIKRPFSYRAKQELIRTGNPLLSSLTVRERPGKMAFRFWQEGPGYDRNIKNMADAIVAADYIHHNPLRRGLCSSPGCYNWSSWAYYHSPEAVPSGLPRVQILSS